MSARSAEQPNARPTLAHFINRQGIADNARLAPVPNPAAHEVVRQFALHTSGPDSVRDTAKFSFPSYD